MPSFKRDTKLSAILVLMMATALCLGGCNSGSAPEEKETSESPIWIQQSYLSFGKVNLGSSKTLTCTIGNPSYSESSISVKVRVEGVGYSIIGDAAFDLDPGATVVVSIRFSPVSLADPEGMLIVSHTATGHITGGVNPKVSASQAVQLEAVHIPLVGSGQ